MRGFFVGSLRPKDKWIAGLPTFDVRTDEPTWPRASPNDAGLQPTGAGVQLTAEEFMAAYEAFPTRDEVESAPVEAVARFQKWLAQHPTLASREPMPVLLSLMAFFPQDFARRK